MDTNNLSKIIKDISAINISNEHFLVREQEDKLSTTKLLIQRKNIVEAKLKATKHKIERCIVKWGALADSIQLDKEIAQEEWDRKDSELDELLYNEDIEPDEFVREASNLFRQRDEALRKVISLEQVLEDMKNFKIDNDNISWRYSHTFDSGWRSSAFDLPDVAEEYRREAKFAAELMELASMFQGKDDNKKAEVKVEVKEEVKVAEAKPAENKKK